MISYERKNTNQEIFFNIFPSKNSLVLLKNFRLMFSFGAFFPSFVGEFVAGVCNICNDTENLRGHS
jgi:hypothetical protein